MPILTNWEDRLYEYIASMRDVPFKYGENDCCTFVGGAVLAVTGTDKMQEFRGKYKSMASSVKALREIGAGDLEKTIDSKFPEVPISLAQRGDIAFYDGSLGVVMDGYAWFVSDEGLIRILRSSWTKAWSVSRG